jgi:hypothetical protein
MPQDIKKRKIVTSGISLPDQVLEKAKSRAYSLNRSFSLYVHELILKDLRAVAAKK